MKLDAELMASMRLETATIFSMRAYSAALVGWQTPYVRDGGKTLNPAFSQILLFDYRFLVS